MLQMKEGNILPSRAILARPESKELTLQQEGFRLGEKTQVPIYI